MFIRDAVRHLNGKQIHTKTEKLGLVNCDYHYFHKGSCEHVKFILKVEQKLKSTLTTLILS